MNFDPASDPRAFRDALGRFATGVTVVTTQGADGPVAITANSFASVSLDPPLVLWSPAKSSRRFTPFAQAQHFAIHVLAQADWQLAADCAKDWAPFDGRDMAQGTDGTPLIEGVLARFECETHAQHDGGDHLIVVGRVFRAMMGQADAPLVFSSGRYGSFLSDGG